jgi:DEAD/DEAH box helicase domain-containing protein
MVSLVHTCMVLFCFCNLTSCNLTPTYYGPGGCHAANHACLALLPLLIMCEPSDLGTECIYPGETRSRNARLMFYERHEHGVGLAEQVFAVMERLLILTLEHVQSCPCDDWRGCPKCVQSPFCREHNEVSDKQAAIIILKMLISQR